MGAGLAAGQSIATMCDKSHFCEGPPLRKQCSVASKVRVSQSTSSSSSPLVQTVFAKNKVKDVRKVVSFEGKFGDYKRLDAVLHAAAIYERMYPDLGTIVVGTGDERAQDKYRCLVDELCLKRTLLVDPKDEITLDELLSKSDVRLFCMPMFSDCFVHCITCGCPTVGVGSSGGDTQFGEGELSTKPGARRVGARIAAAVDTALSEIPESKV